MIFSLYFGLPDRSVPFAVIVADASVPASPVVTVPISSTGVLPSRPSAPSVPSSPGFPSGNTKSILYFGLPSASVPFAMTAAEAFVPFSTVPISSTGVLPSRPSAPVLPFGKDNEIVYIGVPSVSFCLKAI